MSTAESAPAAPAAGAKAAPHHARPAGVEGVRRAGRGQRRLDRRTRALDRLHHRAQRRRQDDAVQHAHRPLQADRRPHHFKDSDITSKRPDRITGAGVARTFQNIRLFRDDDGAGERDGRPSRPHARRRLGVDLPPAASAPRGAGGAGASRARCSTTSAFATSRSTSCAGNLSYGDQRRVEIARALASEPKLLLLDEPTAGMNPQESDQLTDFMRKLRDDLGLTILLIEHDMGSSWASPSASRSSTSARRSPRARRRRSAHNPRVDRGLPREAGRRRHGASRGRRTSTPHYGTIEALQGRLADRGGGGGRDPDRVERRGQVHHAARDLGPHAGQARAPSGSPARRSRAPHRRTSSRRGVAMSPEGRHVFPRMSVRENLDLGAYRRRGDGIAEDLDRVFTLFPRLKERERQKAGTMSGGEQQMLAIGRALMARPEAPDARRAVDGSRADPGRAHLRDDRRDQPARA